MEEALQMHAAIKQQPRPKADGPKAFCGRTIPPRSSVRQLRSLSSFQGMLDEAGGAGKISAQSQRLEEVG